MKYEKRINDRNLLLLLLFLFSTSLISLKTLKKVNIKDIRISGSELFSQNDIVKNSSLKFPIRLILINTYFLEKELEQIANYDDLLEALNKYFADDYNGQVEKQLLND